MEVAAGDQLGTTRDPGPDRALRAPANPAPARSPRCATSRSTAPTTAATPRRTPRSRTPRSPPTSDGATPEPNRRSTSPPTHRSEHGPITRPRPR